MTNPRRIHIGSKGQHKHDGQRIQDLHDLIKQLDRGRIGPMYILKRNQQGLYPCCIDKEPNQGGEGTLLPTLRTVIQHAVGSDGHGH